MNKDITLVILAAGMGSRFGGLKQIEAMGPNGEFIIDYSVYDAIKAGFTKIVFIIKEENYNIFKETVGKRVESHINVSYVFQNNNNIPNIVSIPEKREKPFGTAHAILCCKDVVKEPFAIINADDFYGLDAYLKAAEFLKQSQDSTLKNYGMVGYVVKNTLTESGAVKRGICEVEDGYLTKITESNVERLNGKIMATELDSDNTFEVSEDSIVSMNMLLFTPSIFSYLEEKFPKFLIDNKEKLDTCEFLIPNVLFSAIKEKYANVKVIKTTSTWHGVTYKEDVVDVKNSIKDLINRGEYKNNLWD